jgi:hypothetical protein
MKFIYVTDNFCDRIKLSGSNVLKQDMCIIHSLLMAEAGC